jgi:hypothetical protein
MTSIYDGDPRVQWGSDRSLYVLSNPADQTVAWNIHFNTASGRWDTYDPDGHVYEPASYHVDVDDAIAVVVGEPLWAIEAAMLAWAATHDDWLDPYVHYIEDGADLEQQPDPCTLGGMEALNILLDAEHLVPQYAGPHVAGYLLTNRGRQLAADITGWASGVVHDLILDRVPQQIHAELNGAAA